MLVAELVTWQGYTQLSVIKTKVRVLARFDQPSCQRNVLQTMDYMFVFQLFSTLVLPAVLIGASVHLACVRADITRIVGGIAALADIVENVATSPFSSIMALLATMTAPQVCCLSIAAVLISSGLLLLWLALQSGFFVAFLIQLALIGMAMFLLRIVQFIVRRLKLKLAVTQVRCSIPKIAH